ncbi:DUF6968 family protein [Nocardia cyriacigeorgica]|uniref:DUF6968 family protein n=1 Tax=Nocardia cyriacigeorgica TaxID=135487 RepID=UPI002457281E|nr:hypothetical protein [Nocardia cyriacigeorgica]
MDDGIGDPIATRTLRTGDRDVVIEVAAPEPDGDTWRCRWLIEGLRSDVAHGVDALAALYTALTDLGVELSNANASGANYTVFGQADLGLPHPASGAGAR